MSSGAFPMRSGKLSRHCGPLNGCYVWELCQCYTGRGHSTGTLTPFAHSLKFIDSQTLKNVSVQVRSDWYVYAVLSNLPWVGKELYEKKDVEMDRLLNQIEGYLK